MTNSIFNTLFSDVANLWVQSLVHGIHKHTTANDVVIPHGSLSSLKETLLLESSAVLAGTIPRAAHLSPEDGWEATCTAGSPVL